MPVLRRVSFIAIAKPTALPYNHIMEFIEAIAFTKYVYDYMTEDEYLVTGFSSTKSGSRQDCSWFRWSSESPLGNYW